MEVIQRVLMAVLPVTRKAGDVIDDQFGVVDQSQAAGSGIAEKLVAEAAFDAGNDFPFQECVRRTIGKADKTRPETSQRH